MSATEGLKRGMDVVDMGNPLSVPVGGLFLSIQNDGEEDTSLKLFFPKKFLSVVNGFGST
jgi:hypothetical protein